MKSAFMTILSPPPSGVVLEDVADARDVAVDPLRRLVEEAHRRRVHRYRRRLRGLPKVIPAAGPHEDRRDGARIGEPAQREMGERPCPPFRAMSASSSTPSGTWGRASVA